MQVKCPECDGNVEIKGKPELRELFECGDCGAELVVTNVNPLKIEASQAEGEDWGE